MNQPPTLPPPSEVVKSALPIVRDIPSFVIGGMIGVASGSLPTDENGDFLPELAAAVDEIASRLVPGAVVTLSIGDFQAVKLTIV